MGSTCTKEGAEMSSRGIVYHIFCEVTGKCYVGQTWQRLQQRWYNHCTTSHCVKLRNAIFAYGKDAFVLTLLTVCSSQQELDAAEKYWIDFFNSIEDGYNLKEGGGRGRHALSTIEKITKALTGRKHSEVTRAKMSTSRLKLLSDLTVRQKLQNTLATRNKDPAFREKSAQARRGHRYTTPETLRNAHEKEWKPVMDQFGNWYPSLSAAARAVGSYPSSVGATCQGYHKSCKGYQFRYANSDNVPG